MEQVRTLFRALWQDESGQDLAEYVMLIVLIAIAVIAVFPELARAITDGFDAATDAIDDGLAEG